MKNYINKVYNLEEMEKMTMKTNCLKRILCMLLAIIMLSGSIGNNFAVTANAASTQITANGLKDLSTVQGTGVHLIGEFITKGSKINSINASVSNSGISKTVSGINKNSYKLYDSKLDYALPFGNLSAGEYTITFTVKTTDGNSKKFTCKLTVKSATTITASGITNLSTTQGSGTHLKGTIKSTGSKLSSIKVSVAGTSLCKTQSNINSHSYALENSTLDYAMTFGNLPAGTYTITYTVKTTDGTSKTFTSTIAVKANTTISATGIKDLTTAEGSGTHLKGTIVASGSKLSSVKVAVAGTSLSKTQSNINSNSYDLENSTLDYAMTFGDLPAGTYTITYSVKTVDGTSKNFSSKITLTAKPSPSGGTAGTGTYANMKEYVKGDSVFYVIKDFNSKYCFNQNDYDRFLVWDSSAQKNKNKGCTATSCAMVLCMAGEKNENGQLITPDLYPWNAANGGVAWDYMTKHSSEGESQYLKQIAQELLGGNAVAVWANDYHMVTVIGIRKSANLSEPKASDLLIVDPYGGSITTLNRAQHGGYIYYGYKFYTAS